MKRPFKKNFLEERSFLKPSSCFRFFVVVFKLNDRFSKNENANIPTCWYCFVIPLNLGLLLSFLFQVYSIPWKAYTKCSFCFLKKCKRLKIFVENFFLKTTLYLCLHILKGTNTVISSVIPIYKTSCEIHNVIVWTWPKMNELSVFFNIKFNYF